MQALGHSRRKLSLVEEVFCALLTSQGCLSLSLSVLARRHFAEGWSTLLPFQWCEAWHLLLPPGKNLLTSGSFQLSIGCEQVVSDGFLGAIVEGRDFFRIILEVKPPLSLGIHLCLIFTRSPHKDLLTAFMLSQRSGRGRGTLT